MNVNEIYNLIKNAICLHCRNDKEILERIERIETACYSDSIVQGRKQGISGI